MSLFVFDSGSQNLIKITKRGKKYYVYRLKDVLEFPAKGRSYYSGHYTYKFTWEPTAIAVHNYKPYEDSDVSSSPDVYIEQIKRWTPFKIRKMI